MKERPILFSAPMVRALLEGRKTQTRRVVSDYVRGTGKVYPRELRSDSLIEMSDCIAASFVVDGYEKVCRFDCPYGKPGDRLWVREAWRTGSELNEWNASEIAAKCLDAGYKSPGAPTFYIADSATRAWGERDKEDFGDWGRYRHPRFMPRWASRITLQQITEVRVQRLQEISEADAVAEGIYRNQEGRGGGWRSAEDQPTFGFAASAYRDLWESINGAGSWAVNPWVWAVSFPAL